LNVVSWIYFVVIALCLIVAIFFYERWETKSFGILKGLTTTFGNVEPPSSIVFQHTAASKGVQTFALPKGKLIDGEEYGGLDFNMLQDDTEARQIYRDLRLEEIDYRLPDAARDDDLELYYDFDDDINRGNHADSTKHC